MCGPYNVFYVPSSWFACACFPFGFFCSLIVTCMSKTRGVGGEEFEGIKPKRECNTKMKFSRMCSYLCYLAVCISERASGNIRKSRKLLFYKMSFSITNCTKCICYASALAFIWTSLAKMHISQAHRKIL